MQGFGEAKFRKKSIRLSDLAPTLDWPVGEYEHIRLIGPISAYCNIWFTILTAKNPKQAIPKLCLDLDPETDEFTTEICPYRKSGKGREGKYYVVNCIVRSLQEDADGNVLDFPKATIPITEQHGYKAYWGTKADAKRTPVRLVEMTENAAEKLLNIKKLNFVKGPDGKQFYEVSDPKFGCDIQIMMDPNKKGAAKVDVQKGNRTPITPEERRYIIFPTDLMKPDRLEEAKREMADLMTKIVEDEKKPAAAGEGKPASRRRAPDPDADDTTDISADDLDSDIEMEDRPRNNRASSNRRPARREEPDDLDGDLGDDLDGDLDGELDGDLDGGYDEGSQDSDLDGDEFDEPERPVRRPERVSAQLPVRRTQRPAAREERRPVTRTVASAGRRR